jgi:PKD repeat protein
MAVFQIGKAVETTTPTVSFDVTAAAPLASGTHKIQLVVVDEKGNQSKPTTVAVVVIDPVLPTAVLTAPAQVVHGQSFELDGSKSSEKPPDKITKYLWTLLD